MKYHLKESEEVWDKYYGSEKSHSLIRFVGTYWFTKIFQKKLLSIIHNKVGSFLEAGCGEGIMSSRLSLLGNNVTLMDISQKALNQTKNNFNKMGAKGTFIKGNIFEMQFKDNTFDVVWNQGVLEHLDNPEKAIKEMFRVTKKNGYIIIFVPARFSPLFFYHNLLFKFGLSKLWPFEDQIFYSKNLLSKQIFNATGSAPKVRRIPLSFGFSMIGFVKKQREGR